MTAPQFSSPPPGADVLMPAKQRKSTSTLLLSLVLLVTVVLLVVFTPVRAEEASDQQEVPAALITTREAPVQEPSGPSTLPCDGRGILILESVVVPEGREAAPKINAAVAKWSRSLNPVRYAEPGGCPSLRSELNGDAIYPVFVDYGFNTGELCSAMRNHGGNARTVSERPEFLSPC
ncbi:hypothetical protein [Corynebacterium sputi]|uniref:hypothetical protein n=1 Tax=Corynebacterium sputi TaxID=489915 RepID=UPI00047EB6A6|nr:hypothetical protein [Corynebacterium sputi]